MSNINGGLPARRCFGTSIALSVLASLMALSVARAAQLVTVTNPDPSRQAFSATFSQSSTDAINTSFGTVPAGKRLVIENESVSCYVYGGASILYTYLITNLGRTYLLLQKVGTRPGPFGSELDYYAGTFTSTMYADPQGLGTGDITFVLQATPGTTQVHCDGAIVGHKVPGPPP
jgi:hypothetical protein